MSSALTGAVAAGLCEDAAVRLHVHDYENVFAEVAYDLFEQLTPAGTKVTILDTDNPTEV